MNKTKTIRRRIAGSGLLFVALMLASCVPPTPPVQPGAEMFSRVPPAVVATPNPTSVIGQPAAPSDGGSLGEEARVTRPISEPYRGDLSIFEGKDRERKLQINRVMDILGVREGRSVADIGAGSGWFTVRAARRVGSNGQVYAVEINREYLDHIARRAEREQLGNIRPVLGLADDPKLPPASVDAVLILKTYHEVQEPIGLLRRLHEALKTGGRLGIIDRNGTGGDHGVKRDDVVREVERAGFRLVEEHDFVKPDGEDYFLVFENMN